MSYFIVDDDKCYFMFSSIKGGIAIVELTRL